MKVFVLGLDGATFDCLNPLMEEGVLPNIKEIHSKGASGRLTTIFPPVTAPAWLALATGLNPGKTGVFDYINRTTTETEKMAPISSAYYEKRAIWDYLGKHGYKVGIFNYPTLSPPPRVNGFAISGIGRNRNENLCFPAELEINLNEITKGYEDFLNLRHPKYKKDIKLFFEDINRIIDKQTSAMKFLIQKYEWDFFFAVFSFTDWMQHVLWRDIDETHPLNNPKTSPSVKEKYKEVWNRIDNFIGELISILPKDTNFMIVSDHGAGPIDSVFYPNTWLEQKGWLKKKDLGWKKYFVEKINLFSEGSDNKYYSLLHNIIRTRILKLNGSFDLINLESSSAYSPEHNTMFGCINLTQKGKSLEGFKDQLIKELESLPLTINGIQEVQIYLPEEIYSGPYVNLSPDIFFIINNYKSTVEISFPKKTFEPSPSIEMRTGGHLPEGIFMARGDIFRNIKLENIFILDISPTILALYDLEIPAQIDGRVISECINPEVLRSLNIRKGEEIPVDRAETTEKGDLEEMKKMLKSLGYM